MFETILDYIARTNLFNFIIFASIIAYLFVKIDVIGNIERGAQEVIDSIKKSEEAKDNSESTLKSIEDMISHLEEEVNELIKRSEKNAEIVGEKILSEAEVTVETIKENTEKLVDNKGALLRNDIMQRASLASVEIAKKQILKELENNYDLHNKLIDESVEAINGADI